MSKERQLPFDGLPKAAPGLKKGDPTVKQLQALGKAACVPYTTDSLMALLGPARYLLWVCVEMASALGLC